jgi:hypothetical protein
MSEGAMILSYEKRFRFIGSFLVEIHAIRLKLFCT